LEVSIDISSFVRSSEYECKKENIPLDS
jgi:hypothetical protein